MARDDIIDLVETYFGESRTRSTETFVDKIDLLFMRKDARIDELLQTNNEYLERARAAERLNEELKLSIAGCARLFGQLAALIKEP